MSGPFKGRVEFVKLKPASAPVVAVLGWIVFPRRLLES